MSKGRRRGYRPPLIGGVMISAVASLLAATSGAGAAAAAPGAFDPYFGTGGVATGPGGQATAVAVVPAGDPGAGNVVAAVVAGSTSSPNGSVEIFSPGGSPVAQSVAFPGRALAVAVVPPGLPDSGDIAVAGYVSVAGCAHGALLQLLDAGGNLVGQTTVDCAVTGQFNGVAVDAAGRPVATGSTAASTGATEQMLLARFTTSGAADSTFTPTGYTVPVLGSAGAVGSAVTVVPAGSVSAGSIVVSGAAGTSPVVARFNGSSLDPSFGGQGYVTAGFSSLSGFSGVTIRTADSSVVAVGTVQTGTGFSTIMARYSSSGSPASGFGSGGVVISRPNLSATEGWTSVAYQPVGDFVVAAGSAGATGSTEMVVSEFSGATGALNGGFGSGGTVTRSFSDGPSALAGVAFQPDGRAVAAGDASVVGAARQTALIRLDGPLLAVAAPPPVQVSTTGGTTIDFTVSIDEQLATPAPALLCTTAGAHFPNGQLCATVTIPAGATAVQVPVILDVTVPVGSAQSVAVGTQPANGLTGSTKASVASTTAQHVPPPPPFKGYWFVASDGGVFNYGTTHFWGSTGGVALNRPIVAMAVRPTGDGYWLVASDGGVFAFGHARFYGSTGGVTLTRPVVGMAATPDGRGYWLVASDGGIFAYGDAHFYGSTGGIHLNKPIVGLAPTPDGRGYWLVASDGGIFAFGDARFFGSTGNVTLAKPIVGMAAYPGAGGYWLVASDGGIFAYGAARFHGSTGGITLNKPIVGMASTPNGQGYWMVASDGGVFAFGNARFYGSTGNISLAQPIVGIGE